MSFKYPRPLRFNLGERMRGKGYLTPAQESALLRGSVIVEEKLDGRLVTFEAERFVLCAEDMLRRRTVPYRVPARFAVFDVFETDLQLFLTSEGKNDVTGFFMRNPGLLPGRFSQGVFPVPLLARGRFGIGELPGLVGESGYVPGDAPGERGMAAGIVVKPDRELTPGEHVSGKVDRTMIAPGDAPESGTKGALNEIDSSLLRTY